MRWIIFFLVLPCLALAEQTATPNLSLVQVGDEVYALSELWIKRLKEQGSPDAQDLSSIHAAVVRSPELLKVPMAQKAMANILAELGKLTTDKARAQRDFDHVGKRQKPALSSVPDSEWENYEKSRIERSLESRYSAGEKFVRMNLDMINRNASLPAGQNFAMLGSDPLIAQLQALRQSLSRELAAIERRNAAKKLHIEVVQVLEGGCLALQESGYDYRRIFVAGLVHPDLAEGTKLNILAERNGVFKYTTVQGASSTVEKWVIIE